MPILGIFASANFSDPANFQSIATVTVGSGGTSTITFSSIPSTYKHLQLRWSSTAAAPVNYSMRINGDSASNYAFHTLYGNGSSASAGGFSSQTFIQMPYQAAQPGGAVVDVLDAFSTNKNKTIRALGGADTNGGGVIDFVSGLWAQTSAVTSIVLTSSQTISQYSSFALYGIKGA
jgi:hypothetical protein